jgi:hypothetical protein
MSGEFKKDHSVKEFLRMYLNLTFFPEQNIHIALNHITHKLKKFGIYHKIREFHENFITNYIGFVDSSGCYKGGLYKISFWSCYS